MGSVAGEVDEEMFVRVPGCVSRAIMLVRMVLCRTVRLRFRAGGSFCWT